MTGKKFGVSELGTDVINYISHATQQRLQNLLEKVTQVAQQKNGTFKVIINCSNLRVAQTHCHLLCFSFSFFFLSLLAASYFNLQEDERYEQVSDVRAQLKFFEQLDQMEKQRKEEQEREILLKAAKVTILSIDVNTLNHLHTVSTAQTRRVSDIRSVSLVYISSAAREQIC